MQYNNYIIIKVNGDDGDGGGDGGACDDGASGGVLCDACASGGVWNDGDDDGFSGDHPWFHGHAQFASF